MNFFKYCVLSPRAGLDVYGELVIAIELQCLTKNIPTAGNCFYENMQDLLLLL